MFKFTCDHCNRVFFVYENKDVIVLRGCPYCMSYRINTDGDISKALNPETIEDLVEGKKLKAKKEVGEDSELVSIIKRRGRPPKVKEQS